MMPSGFIMNYYVTYLTFVVIQLIVVSAFSNFLYEDISSEDSSGFKTRDGWKLDVVTSCKDCRFNNSIYSPPSIISDLSISCRLRFQELDRKRPLKVMWKDGFNNILSSSIWDNLSSNASIVHPLTFPFTSSSFHQGKFVCQAQVEDMSPSITISVNKYEGILQSLTPSIQKFLLGSDAIVRCHVSFDGDVMWFRDGTFIYQDPKIPPGQLHITNIGEGSAGAYMCTVYSNNGTPLEYKITVEVYDKPNVAIPFSLYDATLKGHDVFLPCQASGIPKPSLQWFKDDLNTWSLGEPDYQILRNNLKFKFSGRLAGRYYCVAENKYGRSVKHVLVDRNFHKPKLRLYGDSTHYLWAGSEVTFEMKVSSLPLTWNVTWGFSGSDSVSNVKLLIREENFSFKISWPSDESNCDVCGSYNIHVSNEMGSAEETLSVIRADVAPIVPMVQIKDTGSSFACVAFVVPPSAWTVDSSYAPFTHLRINLLARQTLVNTSIISFSVLESSVPLYLNYSHLNPATAYQVSAFLESPAGSALPASDAFLTSLAFEKSEASTGGVWLRWEVISGCIGAVFLLLLIIVIAIAVRYRRRKMTQKNTSAQYLTSSFPNGIVRLPQPGPEDFLSSFMGNSACKPLLEDPYGCTCSLNISHTCTTSVKGSSPDMCCSDAANRVYKMHHHSSEYQSCCLSRCESLCRCDNGRQNYSSRLSPDYCRLSSMKLRSFSPVTNCGSTLPRKPEGDNLWSDLESSQHHISNADQSSNGSADGRQVDSDPSVSSTLDSGCQLDISTTPRVSRYPTSPQMYSSDESQGPRPSLLSVPDKNHFSLQSYECDGIPITAV